jgi:hypothetical protein
LAAKQVFDRPAAFERERGHAADERLELLVLSDEVRLGINLDHGTAGAVHGHADQPLGRDPTRLLGGGGKTLGAQPVHRSFHVAVRLGQRLLAVHHARAGALAQFLDGRGGHLSHVHILICLFPGSKPRPRVFR